MDSDQLKVKLAFVLVGRQVLRYLVAQNVSDYLTRLLGRESEFGSLVPLHEILGDEADLEEVAIKLLHTPVGEIAIDRVLMEPLPKLIFKLAVLGEKFSTHKTSS